MHELPENRTVNEPKIPPMKQLIARFLLAADTRKMTPPFHNHIRKVCPLVAATLILPALAYAQNNQGNGGPGINLGIPNEPTSSTSLASSPLRPVLSLRRSLGQLTLPTRP